MVARLDDSVVRSMETMTARNNTLELQKLANAWHWKVFECATKWRSCEARPRVTCSQTADGSVLSLSDCRLPVSSFSVVGKFFGVTMFTIDGQRRHEIS